MPVLTWYAFDGVWFLLFALVEMFVMICACFCCVDACGAFFGYSYAIVCGACSYCAGVCFSPGFMLLLTFVVRVVVGT